MTTPRKAKPRPYSDPNSYGRIEKGNYYYINCNGVGLNSAEPVRKLAAWLLQAADFLEAQEKGKRGK